MNKRLLLLLATASLMTLPACDDASYPFIQVSAPYEMSFTPSDSGTVDILVRDCYLAQVALVEPGVPVSGGTTVTRTWNLDDEDGQPVTDGLYFVEAALDGAVFETILLEVRQ